MEYERLTALYREPSLIIRHNGNCCAIAAEWLGGMDVTYAAEHRQIGPPAWLSSKYRWGPTRWPLHWCELTRIEILDCGALACLATTLWRGREAEVCSVQLVQRFTCRDTEHWSATWAAAGLSSDWIEGPYIYHECCAVAMGHTIRLWNPSGNQWLDDNALSYCHGEVVALRIPRGPSPWDGVLRFGARSIPVDKWTAL
jgi:hypothetical protein